MPLRQSRAVLALARMAYVAPLRVWIRFIRATCEVLGHGRKHHAPRWSGNQNSFNGCMPSYFAHLQRMGEFIPDLRLLPDIPLRFHLPRQAFVARWHACKKHNQSLKPIAVCQYHLFVRLRTSYTPSTFLTYAILAVQRNFVNSRPNYRFRQSLRGGIRSKAP